MNVVLHDAVSTVTTGWIVGLATGAFILFFAGWCWWAWNPKHRSQLEAAARLPFDNGGDQ
jgi:cbb3-type cytochrome oxidase subunit 3